MLINKTTMSETVAVGDRVAYTLQVINNDAFPIDNVQVTDQLPEELKFVENSLMVNGQSRQGGLVGGVMIGYMAAGAMCSVRFEVDVLSPGDGTVENVAMGTYSYQAPGMTSPQYASVVGEPNILNVINPVLVVRKEASKTAVKLGEIFYFTITVTHTGDVPLMNCVLRDNLNLAFELVPNTLTVNNIGMPGIDLATGVPLGTILGGSSVIVSFAVKVKGSSVEGCITNVAIVTSTFVYPNGVISTRETRSNIVNIFVGVTNFKQITLDSNFTVPIQKPDIDEICGANATVDVLDAYVIPTTKGISNEGQILTGYKAVINGIIKIMITYTTADCAQDMYAIYCEIPFGTYVVLPPDYRFGQRVESTGVVEKITYTVQGPREFYVNIALLAKAMVLG